MNWRGWTFGKAVLVALLVAFAVIGSANVALRRHVPFRIARVGTRVVIGQLTPAGEGEASRLREGDILQAIDGVPLRHLSEATWLLSWVPPYAHTQLTVSRRDSVFTVDIAADRQTRILYLLLDRLTGLAFLILGLTVWWQAQKDKLVSAFLRVNLVVGCAVMWNDFPSFLSVSPAVQAGFAAIYLSGRSFIPAVLIDFITRFTYSRRYAKADRLMRWAFYGIAAAVAISISISVVMARMTSQTSWMIYFDAVNRFVYGAWLLVTVALVIGRLGHAARYAENAWRRRQMRWLLICLVIGATPYVLLEKLPTLWGWPSLIPPDLAMAMLIVTPIGWAMAVASFRMLPVQWTLSRTFVYVVAAGIGLYTLGGLTMLGSAVVRRDLFAATAMLLLFALMLMLLLSRALIDRIRWAVDRAYYGDWFDYRAAVRSFELKLSNSLREQDLGPVLTHDVADVLKVEGCALLARVSGAFAAVGDSDWRVLAATGRHNFAAGAFTLPAGNGNADLVEGASRSGTDGFALAVPLIHAETTQGWLLLGRKRSGAPFSERDRQLLVFLSPVGGMALANAELNQQIMDHERRSVVIGLAGGIAHEIGNALSPLMGQAQLLEYALRQNSKVLPATAVEPPLKVMTEMCARIRRIVQNLSQLSQPATLKQSDVNLNEVAEEAIQLMSETAGRIKRYQLEGEEELSAPAPFRLQKAFCSDLPCVGADRQQLSQVFINLILNAADAMEPYGQGMLTIGTRVSLDPPGVVGFVQDTGPGIPSAVIDKIFLPYFTTKPQGKGTGLGLSFVRSIIEGHQGWVAARSPVEGGARFEFFLPAPLSGEHAQSRNQ